MRARIGVVVLGFALLVSILGCREESRSANDVFRDVRERSAYKPPRDQDRKHVDLRWVSDKTGETLWTVDDIVRFDWDQQVFELKRDKAMEFMTTYSTIGQCAGFRVEDAAGVIYHGSFFSSLSSMGYDGPTILVDRFPDFALLPPLYRIDGAYPRRAKPRDGKSRAAERFAPRLHAALENAGVLAKIDRSSVKPIETKRFLGDPAYIERDLSLSAELFADTLCIDGKARVQLRVNLGDKWTGDTEAIRVEMILVPGRNGIIRAQELVRIPIKQLHKGGNSFTCFFDQLTDESIPDDPTAGPARAALLVFAEKKVGGQWVTRSTHPMYGKEVTILPKVPYK